MLRPSDYSYIQHFDVATLSQYIDFFNFMSYDLHGPWEVNTIGAILRAPGSVVDIGNALLPLWYASVPPSKVNIGVSMYGRSYTLRDPNCAKLGCPYTAAGNPGICTDSPGLLSLWEIALLRGDRNLRSEFLPDVMMNQMTYDNQYIIFDAALTVDKKLQWADGLCLGGLVSWGVDLYSSWGRSVPIFHSLHPTDLHSGRTPITDSQDTTCGAAKSTTCMNLLPNQKCCSKNGFCGGTPAHCEAANGCQPAFGMCVANPPAVSLDGRCGPDAKTGCYKSAFGDCCSKNGYCGETQDYCSHDLGCQNEYGICYG